MIESPQFCFSFASTLLFLVYICVYVSRGLFVCYFFFLPTCQWTLPSCQWNNLTGLFLLEWIFEGEGFFFQSIFTSPSMQPVLTCGQISFTCGVAWCAGTQTTADGIGGNAYERNHSQEQGLLHGIHAN